jgi:hypothetical protein
MNIANAQLWKINEKNSKKNGVHKTVYWVKPEKQLFSNKQNYKVNTRYKGDWKDDEKDGFGTQIYPNGDKYEGEWKNNKREGKGTLWVMNQRKKLIREYTGMWQNDKKNGSGTIFFSNGDRYDGFWVDNRMSGYGRLVYNSKDIYVGMWYNGRKNGYGFLTKNNGDHFEGNWIEDKREGFGSYFFKQSGKILIGEWIDDSPQTAIYCNIKDDVHNYDIFENLKIPILQLDNPIEVLSSNLETVKQDRLIFRTKHSPLHLLYKEEDLKEMEHFYLSEFQKKQFFNSRDIFNFLSSLSFFSLEEIEACVENLNFQKSDLSVEDFCKTIYFLNKIKD